MEYFIRVVHKSTKQLGIFNYYSTIQFTYDAFHNTYRFKAALKKMHVYITI